MRKASTPPSFPLPASPPFLHLKQTLNKRKSSNAIIVDNHLSDTGNNRWTWHYADVWPPVNTFSLLLSAPIPLWDPRPLQEPPPSSGKPWIDTCLAQSGLSPTAGIWQCESIWLRATPAPFLLCFFPPHSRQAGHAVSQCTNQEDLCTGVHTLSPLRVSFEFQWFSCLKHRVTDLSSPWPQKKNLLPLNILSTVQIPSAFFFFFGIFFCLNKINLQRQLSA